MRLFWKTVAGMKRNNTFRTDMRGRVNRGRKYLHLLYSFNVFP